MTLIAEWEESEHPRRSDGRFGSGPGDDSAPPVKTSLDEWTDEDIAAIEAAGDPGQGDAMLREILRRQGFDAKPKKVSSADAIEGKRLYRGLASANGRSGDDFRTDFIAGEMYVGLGSLGNGVYTSPDAKKAQQYADNHGDGGAVVEMVLPPDAKVAQVWDLAPALANLPDRLKDSPVAKDFGRVAALLGYDAIEISEAAGGYVNLLNRGKVAVIA